MRTLFTFAVGVAVGLLLAYLSFGPIDWYGVRDNAGATMSGAGERARDLTVAASVRTALALQKDFDLFGGLRVRAEAGTVTLEGRVATPAQRRLAELIARGVEGVDAVVNRIEVADEPPPEDGGAARLGPREPGDPRLRPSGRA